MYKEKQLIRTVSSTGEVKYAAPNHFPMENWNDCSLVNNDEVEFENGVFASLKDDEFIHYKGMTIGTGKRLDGMFDHESDEDFEKRIIEETEGLPEIPSATNPLDDWLS